MCSMVMKHLWYAKLLVNSQSCFWDDSGKLLTVQKRLNETCFDILKFRKSQLGKEIELIILANNVGVQ